MANLSQLTLLTAASADLQLAATNSNILPCGFICLQILFCCCYLYFKYSLKHVSYFAIYSVPAYRDGGNKM